MDTRLATACIATALAWGAACFGAGYSIARAPEPKVEVLLSSGNTILGQPIAYPQEKPAKITAALITMQPGQSTGPHKHDVPLFAHMLSGEITVDYGPDGKRTYRKGDSFLEAIGTFHDGTNTGDVPASLIAVFAGAEGVRNTEMAGAGGGK